MLQPASFTSRYAYPLGVSFPLRLSPASATNLGLGDARELQQMTSTAAAVGASVGTILATIAGATSAIPLLGAAIGAAAVIAIAIEAIFSGCGETCVQATQIANQVESKLKENVDNYLSQPVRYESVQVAALAVFDQTWQLLLRACGDPALGDAGRRCIGERQRGGVAPWCPKPGHAGCDWFALYRDPIANDPSVTPDPSLLSSGGSTVKAIQNPDGSISYVQVPGGGFNLPIPLLIGLVALGGIFMSGRGGRS